MAIIKKDLPLNVWTRRFALFRRLSPTVQYVGGSKVARTVTVICDHYWSRMTHSIQQGIVEQACLESDYFDNWINQISPLFIQRVGEVDATKVDMIRLMAICLRGATPEQGILAYYGTTTYQFFGQHLMDYSAIAQASMPDVDLNSLGMNLNLIADRDRVHTLEAIQIIAEAFNRKQVVVKYNEDKDSYAVSHDKFNFEVAKLKGEST